MNVPEGLRYSKEHEWVRVDGDTAVIGITDYAQDALGDVVYVDPPEVGSDLTAGDSSPRSSPRSISELCAPISSGRVDQPDLESEPEKLNADPYGEGWICTVTMTDPAELDALLDAAAYQAFIDG